MSEKVQMIGEVLMVAGMAVDNLVVIAVGFGLLLFGLALELRYLLKK